MTKLSAIDGHLIWLECICGHRASVVVADLLLRLPASTTVDQVVSAARCSTCGKRGQVAAMRIVFRGGV